jgi:hypothetical protein
MPLVAAPHPPKYELCQAYPPVRHSKLHRFGGQKGLEKGHQSPVTGHWSVIRRYHGPISVHSHRGFSNTPIKTPMTPSLPQHIVLAPLLYSETVAWLVREQQ